MNYFEVFGLSQALNIDTRTLEKRFHELSRQFHPDYFTTAPAEEKSRALRMTALLNDAYRTLRHPTRRVEYLLTLHQLKSDGSKVPQALLMEVFEINEQLQELKQGGTDQQKEEMRSMIQAKREKFEAELQQASAAWDDLVAREAPAEQKRRQLSKLAEILAESAYIRNLEAELENRAGH